MKETDLSKTGYFDYLIKNGRIEDPGIINKISDIKEIFVSNDGGLDYDSALSQDVKE